MSHCPPELLDDLAGLLAEVRTWAGVVEKSPDLRTRYADKTRPTRARSGVRGATPIRER